jgi:phosphotransferase system enzyme I (PtsP)
MNTQPTNQESLLLTLGEITQLAVHSHDPEETLRNIVSLIHDRFHTAVCSVYFLEPESGELVLGATVGLDPRAVGRVRMHLNEGLTGLVAQQLAPVMVADAFHHPRFKYFPEAGEDPYHSFLGVPLLQGGTLQGVLVIQTVESRTFSPEEVRMFVAVAAQVASLIGDARLLGRLTALAHEVPPPLVSGDLALTSETLTGNSLSPGVGLGRAYMVDGFDEWRKMIPLFSDDLEGERHRLARATQQASSDITHLSRHISELVGEDHGAILQAQLLFLQDRNIVQDLDTCLQAGASAEGALLETLDKYVAALQRVAGPFFQERVYDIKDVFHRLLWQLRSRPERREGLEGEEPLPGDDTSGHEGDRVILVAREASVMELFAVDLDQLAGVVVEHGGAQSHAAILARSLNIPMVGQVGDFSGLLQPGRRLLVDGDRGLVVLDPTPLQIADSRLQNEQAGGAGVSHSAAANLQSAICNLQSPAGGPRVEVNINLLYEARPAVRLGVGGVGLYRSEFLFLARRTLPTEEEQVEIYRKLLTLLEGRPVCVRTFDLRPDKLAAYTHLGAAATRPFDWRRVLDSPPLQQLFREQVRAILRAATVGPARILIPLVTRSEVLDFVLETVRRVRDDLTRSGVSFNPALPLGIMIETAAAVPLVGAWARSVDFFALGTNDLTASALGLERDDPLTADQIDALHPGVLRFLDDVVRAAHQAGRTVSVCGELAAEALGARALAALDVDSISVPVNQFEVVRHALTGSDHAALKALRPTLLAERTGAGVREVLRDLEDGQSPR